MNYVEKFILNVKYLSSQRKKTLAEVLSDTGMNKNLLSSARQRNTLPSAESLLKLSDYFNVSTDYLLGKTDAKKPPAEAEGLTFNIKDNNLRAEVEELVNAFLTLDKPGRVLVAAKAIEEQRSQAACETAKQITETA